jgi:hypothetical protein
MESGKIVPAQKDDAEASLRKDYDGFMKFMENAQPVLEAGSRGDGGAPVTEAQRIDALLSAPENEGLTYEQAKNKIRQAVATT